MEDIGLRASETPRKVVRRRVMRSRRRGRITFLGSLLGGIVSVILAVIVANLISFLFFAGFGWSFVELTFRNITSAIIVTNVIGVVLFWGLGVLTRRPVRYFNTIVLLVATLDTLYVLFSGFPAGFFVLSTVLHYVVALIAMGTFPRYGFR